MSRPDCIDLRNYPTYRCHHDLEGRKAYSTDDPWDLILPGWSGFIAPYGGDYLLACTRGSNVTRQVLAGAPDAVITQDGSDGQNIKFHVSHFETVAKIIRLKRRRVLAEQQRQEQVARLRSFQFRPASSSFLKGPGQAQTAQADL
jgi:hypothetical protein